MALAHSSYKFQQQCNRSHTILQAYVSHASREAELITQSDEIPLDEDQPSENETDLTDFFNEESLSPNIQRDKESVDMFEHEPLQTVVELADFPEDLGTETIEVKTDAGNVPNDIFLNAVEVAASEDNMKLRQRIVLKRMQNSNAQNNIVYRKRATRLNFNYYVKETASGEKVCTGERLLCFYVYSYYLQYCALLL